jgi:hypothetical protein
VYTPPGYEFYQIVAISAMCAVGMLTFASLIAAGVSYLVLREPHPVGEPVTAGGPVTEPTSPAAAFA